MTIFSKNAASVSSRATTHLPQFRRQENLYTVYSLTNSINNSTVSGSG